MKTKVVVKNMGLIQPKSKSKDKVTKVAKPEAKVETLTKVDGRKTRVTMSSKARDHIRAGGTKESLYTFLQKECGLIPEKKWYVNWYFSEAKRKGFLPQPKVSKKK